ncbi:hypothetical protein [Flavonifractor plautii]|mgnify:FL=1|jgi:hypothetical protein|uniref:hypothetical protein n=1 Tax=Flavonifractor plautii TaxID=292800 RepID=UPI00205FE91E|nr:MAG TPA: hypothetical protein [Caudoviricetes sp.]
MTKDGQLNETSTKREIENRFANARRVMDDLCRAYYGMTWDEHERLHGKEENGNEHSEYNQPGDC